MPDIDYPIRDINGAFRYRAARSAVLYPAFKRRVTTAYQAVQAMQSLHKRWRHLLSRLREAGFERFDVDEADKSKLAADRRMAYQYARNCPPFGVITDRQSMGMAHCRYRVCPFCHGRLVAEYYEAAERGLWPDKDNTEARDDVTLVETVATSLNTLNEGYAWTEEIKNSTLAAQVATARARRLTEVNILEPLGYVVSFRTEFGDLAWSLVRSGLFVLPKDTAEEQVTKLTAVVAPAKREVKVHPGPITKILLYQALGRTMRYSATTLDADGADISRYLAAFAKVRTRSRSGLLGSKGSRS